MTSQVIELFSSSAARPNQSLQRTASPPAELTRYAAMVMSTAFHVFCAMLVLLPTEAFAERESNAFSVGPSVEQTERGIAELQRKQRAQLEALKRQFQSLSPPPERRDDEPSHVTNERQRYAQLQRALEEIERRILLEERTAIGWQQSGDPAVRAYYNRICQKIESWGTAAFPKEQGKSLYGRVEVSFEVLPQGTIENIVTSNATSDALSVHAARIVETSAPFDRFPPALAKRFDRIVIAAPFTFSNKQ